MKYLILNGQTKEDAVLDSSFGKYMDQLKYALQEKGQEVVYYELSNLTIKDCIGCYNCWLKTPGICIWKDDMTSILKETVASDVVIIASPVKMSFISSHAKAIKDRQLPLVHPYLKMNKDRMGHIMRYDKQAKQILLLDSDEKSEHITRIYGQQGNAARTIYYMSERMEDLVNELTTN